MTQEELADWEECQYRMDNEGFHYCFRHYSNFPEIKDKQFHKLRRAYLKAAELLENYINEKANTFLDE